MTDSPDPTTSGPAPTEPSATPTTREGVGECPICWSDGDCDCLPLSDWGVDEIVDLVIGRARDMAVGDDEIAPLSDEIIRRCRLTRPAAPAALFRSAGYVDTEARA